MTIATLEHAETISTSKPRPTKRRKNAPIRNRGLPEFASYRDTGCDLAPACLECPLDLCKYDDPNWGKRNLKARRDEEIVRMRANGMTVAQIAAKANTSERTVYRVIQRDYYPKIVGSGKSARRKRRDYSSGVDRTNREGELQPRLESAAVSVA